MSSFFKFEIKRLFLSAAVKKTLVRFVSTRSTSSDSCGNSSREGVGDGDGELFGDESSDALAEVTPLPASIATARSVISMGNKNCVLEKRFNCSPQLWPYTIRDRLITVLCSNLEPVATVR